MTTKEQKNKIWKNLDGIEKVNVNLFLIRNYILYSLVSIMWFGFLALFFLISPLTLDERVLFGFLCLIIAFVFLILMLYIQYRQDKKLNEFFEEKWKKQKKK